MPAKKINSLEDITELQWTQLARKVIESNRRVIVLVHPLYNPASQKYSGSLAGLLKKSKIPIIILEEAEKIPGLKRAFLNEFKLRKQHLILPTAADYPDLIVEKAKQRKEAEISPDSKKLIEILETLGAKSVFVGGMQAVRHSSKAVKEYEMS